MRHATTNDNKSQQGIFNHMKINCNLLYVNAFTSLSLLFGATLVHRSVILVQFGARGCHLIGYGKYETGGI
jgi:hypothetical protein